MCVVCVCVCVGGGGGGRRGARDTKLVPVNAPHRQILLPSAFEDGMIMDRVRLNRRGQSLGTQLLESGHGARFETPVTWHT